VTRARQRARVVFVDPAATNPSEYESGQASANRLIDNYPEFVDAALSTVTEHMENWPVGQSTKLSERDWARDAGFAHTLREYREAHAS